MSAVAARLGVSVSGLYHHVKGRDELARLVARSTLAEGDLPPDDGQHWSEWVLAYARILRRTLREQRGAISHVHPGETGSPTSLDRLEQVLRVLMRAGFSGEEAMLAFMVVTNCISGFVHQDNQIESEARAGRPYVAEFHRALSERRPDELPLLRSLPGPLIERDLLFDDQLRTVLAGIAARHAQEGRRAGRVMRARAAARRVRAERSSAASTGRARGSGRRRPTR